MQTKNRLLIFNKRSNNKFYQQFTFLHTKFILQVIIFTGILTIVNAYPRIIYQHAQEDDNNAVQYGHYGANAGTEADYGHQQVQQLEPRGYDHEQDHHVDYYVSKLDEYLEIVTFVMFCAIFGCFRNFFKNTAFLLEFPSKNSNKSRVVPAIF